MNKIPTAEDTLRHILSSCNIEYYELEESCPEVINKCLETIKNQNILYVEAALKAAAEKADIDWELKPYSTDYDAKINKKSILSAYPKENIQ